MKKFISFSLMAAVVAGSLHAVPAKRGFTTFTQSDGSKMTVELTGDEYCHAYVTSDGLTVRQDSNGDFYYVTAQGMSQVKAHDMGQRTTAELNYIAANKASLSFPALVEGQQAEMASKRHMARGPKKVGDTQVPNQGNVRVPILLVNYTDKKMANPIETFQEVYQLHK